MHKVKEVDSYEQYDIKLQLDVMSQNLISEIILQDHPEHSIIGRKETVFQITVNTIGS